MITLHIHYFSSDIILQKLRNIYHLDVPSFSYHGILRPIAFEEKNICDGLIYSHCLLLSFSLKLSFSKKAIQLSISCLNAKKNTCILNYVYIGYHYPINYCVLGAICFIYSLSAEVPFYCFSVLHICLLRCIFGTCFNFC